MKLVQLALVGAATLAVAQPHNHAHRHPARHGSPVKARGDDYPTSTTTVDGPVVTVYELNGDIINWDDVEQGVKDGKYVLVQDKVEEAPPTSSSAAPIPSTSTSATPTPAPTTTSSLIKAAQFLEIKTSSTPVPTTSSTTSSSSSTSTTPTSTYVAPTTSTYVAPTTTSTTEAPEPTTSAAAPTTAVAKSSSNTASGSSGTASGSSGIEAEFPSGEIDCSTFPSDYGAVAADWLHLGGWTGIQNVPGFSLTDKVISYIETAISGSSCTKNSYCSYACPAGYQKSQWPASQGSTGQSIGGLYCNSKGKLELSREAYPQICTKGVGGISVSSSLSKNVAVCRTDYPGTESETVALNVPAGGSAEVTCPDAKTYYNWQGSATSAQYYINPSGYSVEKACQWGTAGSNIGNWAPVNMGVGRGAAGGTFISIFQNAPTNPDGVLDFSINITGDVSGKCSYKGGKFYSNGVESPTGCTVGVTGEAVFEFS